MNSKLIVDEKTGLHEFRDTSHQPQNVVIRLVAKIISYVFHPLFIPVYIAWFLITLQPYLFASFTTAQKTLTLISFFVMYSFFPLVTVLLSKALGFIDSIYLRTQKERIIPYVASGVYYFWMAYVKYNQPETPVEIIELTIAIFLASSIGLIANIYMKVSMHAMSMGILLAFFSILASEQTINYTIYLSVAVLVVGLVCTARLIVSDHTQKEIYVGLLVGIASQVLAVLATGVLLG